jgi:hypothetical protein
MDYRKAQVQFQLNLNPAQHGDGCIIICPVSADGFIIYLISAAGYTSCVFYFNGLVLHNCVNDFIVGASNVTFLSLSMSAVLFQFVVLNQLVGPSAYAWPPNRSQTVTSLTQPSF